ncbi:MAG: thiamine phosphate synthase [Candidatus Competibacterales bacterium]
MKQSPLPSPFYPILPDLPGLARLLPKGLSFVQLRYKHPDPELRRRTVAEGLALARRHGCQLVINDHWREAIDAGAEWVHLGQEDLATADLKALRRAGIKLGVSTHSEAELAVGLAAAPDYLALGPIYPSGSKATGWAPQGLEAIGRWRRQIPCPLVAIGGITLERAPEVWAAGADAVAVIGDLLHHPHPEVRVEQWLAQLPTGPKEEVG